MKRIPPGPIRVLAVVLPAGASHEREEQSYGTACRDAARDERIVS